jgi:uncharacterized membrane protein (UPF0127 family)
MNFAQRLFLLMMVPLVLASSCTSKKEIPSATTTQDLLPAGEPDISFEKGSLRIKDQVLTVEIAKTPQQRARGYMYRKQIPQGQGMLFVFSVPDYLNFYMKNTFVPLSIAFLDSNRKIIDIQDMAAAQPGQESFPIYISKGEAQYALEVPQGWFREKSIKVGDQAEWSF